LIFMIEIQIPELGNSHFSANTNRSVFPVVLSKVEVVGASKTNLGDKNMAAVHGRR